MREVAYAAIAAAAISSAALAHDFYTGKVNRVGESCCGLNDCAPIPNSDVRLVREGYAVKFGDGEAIIPDRDTLQSPDGRFHKCVWGEQIKCLFVPPLGA